MFTTQILIIAVLTLVLAGLQYVLSLMESKIPGLVLPVLTGLGAIAACVFQGIQSPPDTFALVVSFILSLILLLIPAALLTVVYVYGRKKRRTKYGHEK